jgi:hypothetical protein
LYSEIVIVNAEGTTQLLKTKKGKYINYEIWIMTFGGAFGRANVYASNVGEDERLDFRMAIRENIDALVTTRYRESPVSSERHVRNLAKIKSWIDANYSPILRNGEIRFGVVQKLVNLFLKYNWCMGLIMTPPHCPFDRTIIEMLKLKNPPNWTELNDVSTYNKLVERAAELAKPMSIAEWELTAYSRK